MAKNTIVKQMCFVVVTLTFGCSAVFAKKPSLEVRPSIIDIGSTIIGQKVTAKATIINQGTRAVKIKKIQTSCGCLDVKTISRIIPAGESIKLEVDVDSLGRPEGDYKFVIWFLTDDPYKPAYTVNVTGKFEAKDHRLLATPPAISAGVTKPGSRIMRVVQIQRSGEVRLGSITISASAKWIDSEEQVRTEDTLRIYVTICIPMTATNINEELFIKGSDPNDFLRIPIRGTVIPRINLSPQIVLMIPGRSEYRFSLVTHDGRMPRLSNHSFQGDALHLLSCNAYVKNTDHLVVTIERRQSHEGFASGKLLLQYEGETKIIEVVFVSPPLTLNCGI